MGKNKNRKKVGLLVLSFCLIGIVIIGVSYAWWRFTVIQSGENTAISKCLKIELSNESDTINLTNMYPITDEEGRKLTPYTFTLTNTCTMSAFYKLNMEMLEETTLNSKYVAVTVNNGIIKLLSSYAETPTVIDGSTESRTLDTGILSPNSSKDYSVSIWMDKSVTLEDDAQNKTFKSKIVVNAEATNIKSKTEEIIAQLDTSGKCPTVNEDGTITVSSTEELTSAYVCSAPDNYGTSYYYRGNVENNYVKLGTWSDNTADVVYGFASDSKYDDFEQFSSIDQCQSSGYHNKNCTLVSRKGKPMYWRIVRINGNGTIRLLYDGTKALQDDLKYIDKIIVNKSYDYSKYHKYAVDNASSGYMHGEITGIVKSSKTYKTTLENTTTYHLSASYSTSNWFFTLNDPINIAGSDIDEKYIGYYLEDGYGGLKQISKITKSDNGTEIEYYYITFGTTSKEQAQSNSIDSFVKENVDEWYKTNILDTSVEEYLTDEIFCSDRTISNVKYNDNYTNLGYGSEPTVYRWGQNMNYNSETGGLNSNESVKNSLLCSQQNDAFTVNDTTHGNGALTYPAGLLSLDEAFLTNASSTFNNIFGPMLKYEQSLMFMSYDLEFPNITPVINVKTDTLLYGNGTASNPYRSIE